MGLRYGIKVWDREGRVKRARAALLRLYVADLGLCILLGDLYMARKTRYSMYGHWNCNADASGYTDSVPYISHLVFSKCLNLL